MRANLTLKAELTSLVELSRTNGNAVEYLHTVLGRTTDRNDRRQVELAIRHAEKNAAAL